jgi:Arc/MetJ-type ribon-helix-helix transcriptional regulator
MQLTPEQEERIRAVVNAGAYSSAEEALNAAVAAVETAAAPGFERSEAELEGLASQELTDEEFWDSIDRETNTMLAAHKLGPVHESH